LRIVSLLIQLHGGIGSESKSEDTKSSLISEIGGVRHGGHGSGGEYVIHNKQSSCDLGQNEKAEEELHHAEWYWGDISK
jgi:hypothetical protein